jgi:phage terminase large subunit-like protein
VKAGPKASVTAEPLDLSNLPARGEPRITAFAKDFLLIPQGKDAKKPVRLRPWQRDIVRHLVPARGLQPRQAVISMPRGNGKSGLSSVLAAYFLLADQVEGAEVLCVATDERQARIVFNRVRRMIELNPALDDRCQIFSDRIYVPHTDSSLVPLPSVVDALQGWSPTFAVVDELNFVREDSWSAMTLASGKRDHSLILGISTPGDNRDSVLWRLKEFARENPNDRSFYYREYATPEHYAITDEKGWKEGNPALGDFLMPDAIRLDARIQREDNFRRFRLGQWVNGASAWLSRESWDACKAESVTVDAKQPVVLAFDGSFSDDCSALTGCTVPKPGEVPHLFVVDIWARDEVGWTVDRELVDQTVHAAFRKYNVQEMLADPYGWRSEIQSWAKKYGHARVLEYPSYVVSRMAPFTDSLATAVRLGKVTHDGNTVLAQHVANCRAKATSFGDVIVKDRKGSPRKIDSAVTSVMSYGRAMWHSDNPQKGRRLVAV